MNKRYENRLGGLPTGSDERDSQGPVDLNELPTGAMLLITTQNRHYVLQKRPGLRSTWRGTRVSAPFRFLQRCFLQIQGAG